MDGQNTNDLVYSNPEWSNQLYVILRGKMCMVDERAQSIALALLDIRSAFETVYVDMVPKLMESNMSKEELDDLLLEIRMQFQHVDYHIHDAEFEHS
jgi:hypothetical protein